MLSESFKPSGPKSFIPLSSEGLCEAEIITPKSARKELVNLDTPGVGIGPKVKQSIPIEVNPETKAGSII